MLVAINPDGGDAVSERPAVEVLRVPYRGIARVAVLVGLAAFVLPFATVSCGGQKALTGTGLNGIAGGQYTVSGHISTYSGDVSFLLALLGGVVALIVLFLLISTQVRAIAAGLASLWSAAMLLLGQAHLNGELMDANLGSVVTVRWEPGFWIALAAFAVAAVLMALQLYSVRAAPAGPYVGPDFSLSQGISRSFVITASGIAAAAGSLLIILACALPYVHYIDSSIQPSSPSVFNPGFGPSNWFAVEPVGVAVLVLTAAVALLVGQKPIIQVIAAFVVLAYGVQTLLLFVGYVYLAIRSDSAQVAPGGVVGMIAGLLLAASGLAAALSLLRRQPANLQEEPRPADAS
jgi:hypothetical protein